MKKIKVSKFLDKYGHVEVKLEAIDCGLLYFSGKAEVDDQKVEIDFSLDFTKDLSILLDYACYQNMIGYIVPSNKKVKFSGTIKKSARKKRVIVGKKRY